MQSWLLHVYCLCACNTFPPDIPVVDHSQLDSYSFNKLSWLVRYIVASGMHLRTAVDDALQELQQAGIHTMSQSDRQIDVHPTAGQSAPTPSVLTGLIGVHSSIVDINNALQLPQPILLNAVNSHLELPAAMLAWGTVTADFNIALDSNQERAAKAPVPAIKDDPQGEHWLAIMASHALPATGAAVSISQAAVAANHSQHEEGSCQIRAEVLNFITDCTDTHREHLEPSMSELEVPHMRMTHPQQQDLLSEVFHEFQTPKAPQYMPASMADCNVMNSSKATYHSLVARDLTLHESFFTLPVVLMDDENHSGLDEAESKADTCQQCMAECRFRPQKTGHLDLYMDWSLTDSSCLSSPSFQSLKRQLDRCFDPDSLPPLGGDPGLSDGAIVASVINSISEAAPAIDGILYHAVQQPEQLPQFIRDRLRRRPQSNQQADKPPAKPCVHSQAELPCSGQLALGNYTRMQFEAGTAAGDVPTTGPVVPGKAAVQTAPSHSIARLSGAQGTGVFQQRAKRVKPAADAKAQAASAGNDMAFFLGLQHTTSVPAPTHVPAPAAPLADHTNLIDLCSDDSGEEAEEEVATELPHVQHVILRLSERLERLLETIKQEQQALLRETDGIDTEVVNASLAQQTVHVCSVTCITLLCASGIHALAITDKNIVLQASMSSHCHVSSIHTVQQALQQGTCSHSQLAAF